jgi:pyridoxal phosphate enzyme (YggS family)
VVTKTFPVTDVLHLVALGVTDVGENRDQDAAPKASAVAEALGVGGSPRWHFIGQLQRNKVGSVARYADVVQSVDRERLVVALDGALARAARRLDVLVQVDLRETVPDGDPGRGGVRPQGVAALADVVAASSALTLRGLMAVAPREGDPRAAFERLASLAAELRTDHPGATWCSAGMSGDLEAAVACGATHLRVGSAILGSRPSLQ